MLALQLSPPPSSDILKMRIDTRWLLFAALMSLSNVALSVNVRGRVDIRGQYGVSPMAGAEVRLCSNSGCENSITSYDGIYFVTVPAGQYSIFINGRQRATIAIPNTQEFDIAPVLGN